MVLTDAAEARQQRILLKRERVRQENEKLAQTLATDATNSVVNEDTTPSDTGNTSDVVIPEVKKPKLDQSEGSTSSKLANSGDDDEKQAKDEKPELDIPESSIIIANVFRYLEQEYKYMRLRNPDHVVLRPLSAVRRRTSEATGVTRVVLGNIIKADRAGLLRKRADDNE